MKEEEKYDQHLIREAKQKEHKKENARDGPLNRLTTEHVKVVEMTATEQKGEESKC